VVGLKKAADGRTFHRSMVPDRSKETVPESGKLNIGSNHEHLARAAF
jgi:hypothetical protein